MNEYQQDLQKAIKQITLPKGNVLITGATGLIGGCLTDMLMMHSSCDVYALGRNRERAKRRFAAYWDNPRFHFIEQDICKPLTLDVDFHYIIHQRYCCILR